ncbi:acyltransferase [Lysobacter sp. H21R4]|uniref:acyltransferase n=1 Tax=Lysobacter sp. H21R4 TaxID=2781021 RepID=UPI00188946A4|nr:acyltransferase [Lysobacter sp. H21R4]QOY62012.1 acyltransferase [Lysobacter sp. H21R4]
MKIIWMALYYGFVQFIPSSSFPGFSYIRPIRRFVVSKFAEVSAGANIERRAYLGSGRGVSIGMGSGVGARAEIHGPVRIGDYVLMAPEVIIFSRNHSFMDRDVRICDQGYGPELPVEICDDVWIGARAIILPGLVIGKGAVVGAGSVVTKSVAPYSVVAGNPAKTVKMRG